MASNDHSADPQDRGARYRGEPWCESLRAAASGLSYAELAERTGYGRTKIAQVLGGRRRPSIEELLRICAALGLPPLRLLAMTGDLPGISTLLEYVDQLEEEISKLETASLRSPIGTTLPGSAVIAARLEELGAYRTVLIPNWLGTRLRHRHYSDIILIEPLTPGTSVDTARQSLGAYLAKELAWYGAGFVDDAYPARDVKAVHPQLVINVPRFLTARRGSGHPLPGAPRSVCVLGNHWAGAADVASFLGLAFDHDYSHVGAVASRAFSTLSHEREHPLFIPDRLEVARTYTLGAHTGRRRVWSAGGEAFLPTARQLASTRQSLPVIIHLRSTDSLIEWTSQTRSAMGHTAASASDDARIMRQERNAADQALRSERYRLVVIDSDLPQAPDAFAELKPHERADLFLDSWSRKAEEAISRISNELSFKFDLEQAHARAMTLRASPRPPV